MRNGSSAMAVADIIYFSTLASAALVSAVVLLRQFFRGDLMELDRSVLQHDAVPTPEAAPAYVRRLRAA